MFCVPTSLCMSVFLKGNTSLQIDHHSSTAKDRGGVSEQTLTQPIMKRVVIMQNPCPLNRGHWSNAPPLCLILCLACIVWSSVVLSNSSPQYVSCPAHSPVSFARLARWRWRKESESHFSCLCRKCKDDRSDPSSIRNNCDLDREEWV